MGQNIPTLIWPSRAKYKNNHKLKKFKKKKSWAANKYIYLC